MTITLLAPDGVAVTAQQERQARAAGHGGGSGRQLGGRSGFRIGTPSTVLTASSTTWTLGPCAAMIDPGASTHQGMYGWSSDANVTGTVTAADATYARKDIVYIQVNDSSAGDGSGATTAPVLYLAGTASASPVAPSLPPRSFLVGTISVPQAGGGSPTVQLNPARYVAAGGVLPVADVAERDALTPYPGLAVKVGTRPVETWDGTRWGVGAMHAEFTASIAVPSSSLWGPGAFTLDANASKNAEFASPGAADFLTVNTDGLYAIGLQMATNGPAAGASMSMRDSTGSTVWSSTTIPNGATDQSLPVRFIYLTAGTTFRFRFYHTAASAQTWTTRATVTKVG